MTEGGPESFTFFLSFLKFCFNFSHFLIQVIQCQVNQLLTIWSFPASLNFRHFLSQANLQRFYTFKEVTLHLWPSVYLLDICLLCLTLHTQKLYFLKLIRARSNLALIIISISPTDILIAFWSRKANGKVNVAFCSRKRIFFLYNQCWAFSESQTQPKGVVCAGP